MKSMGRSDGRELQTLEEEGLSALEILFFSTHSAARDKIDSSAICAKPVRLQIRREQGVVHFTERFRTSEMPCTRSHPDNNVKSSSYSERVLKVMTDSGWHLKTDVKVVLIYMYVYATSEYDKSVH